MQDDDIELKRMFVNRQKRLFNNILRQLEMARSKGACTEAFLQRYKSCYNEIVFEDAKKDYYEYKLKQRRKHYIDDLFSDEI